MNQIALTLYFASVAEAAAYLAAASKGGAAAPAASTVAATTAAPTAAAAASTEIKLEALQAKGKEVMDKKGKDAFVAVLGKFSAKKLSDVKKEDYAKFIAACDETVKAEEDPFK